MTNFSRSITPSLGMNLGRVYKTTDAEYNDGPNLGTVVRALNGRMYIFAQATGTIADNTAVILTEPAMTIAAGAGAWTTRAGAMVATDRAWVESNAI